MREWRRRRRWRDTPPGPLCVGLVVYKVSFSFFEHGQHGREVCVVRKRVLGRGQGAARTHDTRWWLGAPRHLLVVGPWVMKCATSSLSFFRTTFMSFQRPHHQGGECRGLSFLLFFFFMTAKHVQDCVPMMVCGCNGMTYGSMCDAAQAGRHRGYRGDVLETIIMIYIS